MTTKVEEILIIARKVKFMFSDVTYRTTLYQTGIENSAHEHCNPRK